MSQPLFLKFFPAFFPKKAAHTLTKHEAEEVKYVYRTHRPKLLHLTVDAIPHDKHYPKRVGMALALAALWLVLYPWKLKLMTIAAATAYSFTESMFTFGERGAPYTSVAQYWANLIYSPILLVAYGRYLRDHHMLYVLLFPVNVWVLEVIVQALITVVHGRNVAWTYLDYTDSYFDGAIRIGHAVAWIGLGIICLLLDLALSLSVEGVLV